MGRLERILSSLAREWLRIANRLLIVEDPELALRSSNKLLWVNRAERHKEDRARKGSEGTVWDHFPWSPTSPNAHPARQIRKIKPLKKKRFKPQVSAVFDAGSIRIDAYCNKLWTRSPGQLHARCSGNLPRSQTRRILYVTHNNYLTDERETGDTYPLRGTGSWLCGNSLRLRLRLACPTVLPLFSPIWSGSVSSSFFSSSACLSLYIGTNQLNKLLVTPHTGNRL